MEEINFPQDIFQHKKSLKNVFTKLCFSHFMADNGMDARKANGNTHGNFSLPHVDSSDGGSSHGSSWTEDTVRKCCSKKTLYKRVPVLSLIGNYHKGLIVADLVAGVTVGLTMVPQSIAYASVAGLPPQVRSRSIVKNFESSAI